MSDEQQPTGLGPVEYSSRIGGGRSARLIALGVVVVLAGFIGVGILGREPAPPPLIAQAPQTPQPSADPTPDLTPTESPAPSVTAERDRVRRSGPPASEPQAGDAYLATLLQLDGTAYFASMDEVSPGHWQVAYHIPYPRPALEASLVLAQIPGAGLRNIRLSVGSWDVSLVPMTLGWAQAFNVLDVVQAPTLESGAPALARTGFRISAVSESKLYHGLLHVDVRRTIEPDYPDESYAVDVRAGRFATRISLAGVEPGHFAGLLVVPDSVQAGRLDLTLVAMPARNPLLGIVSVHEFMAELPALDDFVVGHSLISISPARDVEPGGAELIGHQHEFSAETVYSGQQRAFVLHLFISGDPEEDASER